MVLNLWLDLHDELIQLDDLYKERHNNINDSLSRLHALKRNLVDPKEQRVYNLIVYILVLYLTIIRAYVSDLCNN